MSPTSQTHSDKGITKKTYPLKGNQTSFQQFSRWVPACAVVTEPDIALFLRGKEGNRTTYSEERTEDLEKYGILVVG